MGRRLVADKAESPEGVGRSQHLPALMRCTDIGMCNSLRRLCSDLMSARRQGDNSIELDWVLSLEEKAGIMAEVCPLVLSRTGPTIVEFVEV